MSRDRSADNQGKPKAGKTGAEARGSARGFGRLGEALSGLRDEIRTQQRLAKKLESFSGIKTIKPAKTLKATLQIDQICTGRRIRDGGGLP